MKIAENGRACCDNCGSDRFTAPQMKDDGEGGVAVFMCCSNCAQPTFTGLSVPKEDTEFVEALGEFFARPEAASE